MEKGKDEEKFHVIEWTIKNFSYWNREVHGNVITSPETCFFEGIILKLYPRGLNGGDECLVVYVENSTEWDLQGDLSILGPDGTLLCKQQVDSEMRVKCLKFPEGPKFKEVVTRIKMKGDKNRIILRYRKKSSGNGRECLRTKIEVSEISVKISRNIFDSLSSCTKNLVDILYPENENAKKRLEIWAANDENQLSRTTFWLHVIDLQKAIWVSVRVCALNVRNEEVKSEEYEHLFRDTWDWKFSTTLTDEEIKDIVEERTHLFLNLKIIHLRYMQPSWLSMAKGFHILHSNILLPPSSSTAAIKSLTSSGVNSKRESVTVLSKELMCLYQDQDFSDFTLKCDNVSIPVHKAILSARSPVFKTMLSCDMREAASSEVVITDLDPSTLARFIAFLYTGNVEDLREESALNLYYAADKYQVPSLKKDSTDFLIDNVSVSNVCDILLLANRHQDDNLIGVARDFILNNYNDVMASEKWNNFMRSQPLLAVETVTYLAEKILL